MLSISERVVITHTDLDGVASAALVIRKLGGYDRLYFAQPHQLHAVLNKVPNKSEVYITDLGINSSTIDRVVKQLRRIISSGGIIYWFDHHIWDEDWVKRVKSVGTHLYIDRTTCAAGVVVKYLGLNNDPSAVTLAKATCSLDLWRFDHWLGNYLGRVVGYRGGSKWKEYITKELVNFNGKLSNEFLRIVEDEVTKELRLMSKALKKAGYLRLNDLKIVYYFKSNEEHITSYIAHLLMSRYRADIAIICRRGSVSLRSREIDVRKIAKVLGGGGHSRAAGAPIKPPLHIRILSLLGLKGPHLKWCVNKVLSAVRILYSYS